MNVEYVLPARDTFIFPAAYPGTPFAVVLWAMAISDVDSPAALIGKRSRA